MRFQNKAYNGLFLCWAPESIELTMRTCSPPGTNGVVTNFEVRTFDGCANPPLGLASLIVSGLDGLRNNSKILEPVGMLDDLLAILFYYYSKDLFAFKSFPLSLYT